MEKSCKICNLFFFFYIFENISHKDKRKERVEIEF